MITTPTPEIVPEVFTEALKVEVLATINLEWENFDTANEMATAIMDSYIFGPVDTNVHIKLDDIITLIAQVDIEKNPLPVVEPVIEEPLPVIEG